MKASQVLIWNIYPSGRGIRRRMDLHDLSRVIASSTLIRSRVRLTEHNAHRFRRFSAPHSVAFCAPTAIDVVQISEVSQVRNGHNQKTLRTGEPLIMGVLVTTQQTAAEITARRKNVII
jgi:hypothetical protein